ncbi:MAG: hypothetical protein J5852_03905 [Clostridia bacterium]|nr:hypothetical protein [Clostridia bacterium]
MNNNPLFIGIDIGTQGTKTVLSDINGKTVQEAFCPSNLIRPDSQTVYEEPQAIFESIITTVKAITDRIGEKSRDIVAMCLDAQMAGIMAVDKDFGAVTPLDSWLDSRCRNYTAQIKERVGDAAVKSSGGQIIHSHASKILWWKNEYPDTYKKIYKFIEPNGYVAGKLCGISADEAFMDYTFLHFNVFSDNANLCFNKALLSEFGIEENKLPKIVSPEYVVGEIIPRFADDMGLPAGVKVLAGCGDTAASSLGAGITKAGLAYDVAGTASVFACCTDKFTPDVKNHTLLFGRSVCKGLFLPLSYVSGGGLCLKWFSGISGKSFKELDGAAELSDSKNTVFIPHFSGRTLPLDDRVSGAFLGIDSGTDTGVMFKSVLESIAFEYKSYLDILVSSGALSNLECVYGVGGGAKSAVFSKIKADVLGADYISLINADSAPAAMARLAAKATGYIGGDYNEIFGSAANGGKVCGYDPQAHEAYKAKAKRYLKLLNGYSDYIS